MSVSLLLLNLPPLLCPLRVQIWLNSSWGLVLRWNRDWLMIEFLNAWDSFTQYVYSIWDKTWWLWLLVTRSGEELAGNKKPHQLRRGLCFSCGEYRIWTYATNLSVDGLAIRCITTLPTLHCGGWGTRTPKAVRPPVFKTGVLPIRANPPSVILKNIKKQWIKFMSL